MKDLYIIREVKLAKLRSKFHRLEVERYIIIDEMNLSVCIGDDKSFNKEQKILTKIYHQQCKIYKKMLSL